MKMMMVDFSAVSIERYMYNAISDPWKAHDRPCRAKVYALPIACADALLEFLKLRLEAIEGLALAIVNLLGALFSEQCTIKGFLFNVEKMAVCAARSPIALGLAPFKVIIQTFAIVTDPANAKAYNHVLSIGGGDTICSVYKDTSIRFMRSF